MRERPYIETWIRLNKIVGVVGISGMTIREEQNQAEQDNAPGDALYKDGDRWVTVRDIEAPHIREALETVTHGLRDVKIRPLVTETRCKICGEHMPHGDLAHFCERPYKSQQTVGEVQCPNEQCDVIQDFMEARVRLLLDRIRKLEEAFTGGS